MSDTSGPSFFILDEIPWPDEAKTPGAPKELIEEAKRKGARRKFLARGDGGFHSQYSEFPPGYTVPMHSHDHDELIVVLDGSCTLLGDGPTLHAHDSMVLRGGYEYGFTAGDDGMSFLTIRTGVANVTMKESG
jgi:quercetin dioxygenase-like cupin family protein